MNLRVDEPQRCLTEAILSNHLISAAAAPTLSAREDVLNSFSTIPLLTIMGISEQRRQRLADFCAIIHAHQTHPSAAKVALEELVSTTPMIEQALACNIPTPLLMGVVSEKMTWFFTALREVQWDAHPSQPHRDRQAPMHPSVQHQLNPKTQQQEGEQQQQQQHQQNLQQAYERVLHWLYVLQRQQSLCVVVVGEGTPAAADEVTLVHWAQQLAGALPAKQLLECNASEALWLNLIMTVLRALLNVPAGPTWSPRVLLAALNEMAEESVYYGAMTDVSERIEQRLLLAALLFTQWAQHEERTTLCGEALLQSWRDRVPLNALFAPLTRSGQPLCPQPQLGGQPRSLFMCLCVSLHHLLEHSTVMNMGQSDVSAPVHAATRASPPSSPPGLNYIHNSSGAAATDPTLGGACPTPEHWDVQQSIERVAALLYSLVWLFQQLGQLPASISQALAVLEDNGVEMASQDGLCAATFRHYLRGVAPVLLKCEAKVVHLHLDFLARVA